MSNYTTDSCVWLTYQFLVFQPDTDFEGIPGVYIFTKTIENLMCPIFVGHSDDIGNAISQHVKDPNIWPFTEKVHVHLDLSDKTREDIIKTLVGYYNPPRNVEYRKSSSSSSITEYITDLWLEKM